MVFVFDLDDTLCETDKYSRVCIRNFFKENEISYIEIDERSRIDAAKFSWDTNTAKKWYREYGDNMISKVPCKKGAKELLDSIHRQGDVIVIATVRSKDWYSNPEEIAMQWLRDNDIKYDKLYTGRFDKENICEEEQADFFIDDSLNATKKVADYLKGKTKSILMTSDFNEKFEVPENVYRVDKLEQLYNLDNIRRSERIL